MKTLIQNQFPTEFKKAKEVAKLLGLKITTKSPNNGFGGYEIGSTKIFVRIVSEKYDYLEKKSIAIEPYFEASIVSTCSCCGDGSRVKIKLTK